MTASGASSSTEDIFINCPFDDEYLPLFDAMLFAILACGFDPRCALEHSDGAEVRIEKLYKLIRECGLAVHDLSRVQWSTASQLPRFNMPLELGIWLGAKRFGNGQKTKVCLILDAEQFRYQRFVSDIAGQDPTPHGNDPLQVVRAIRNWLQMVKPESRLPGGDEYVARYGAFQAVREKLATARLLDVTKLIYLDRLHLMQDWLVVKAGGGIISGVVSLIGVGAATVSDPLQDQRK